MRYFISATFLNLPTYILSDLQMHTAFYLVADMQYLLLAIGAYNVCPIRQFRFKLIICIHLIITSSLVAHNIFVYAGLLGPEVSNHISFICLVGILVTLSFILLTKWDSLPVDKIETGYIYEVIGKPKNNLQLLAYIVPFSRGGTCFITDGVDSWFFSRHTGKQEKEKFDKEALIGRKVVRVCESSDYIIDKLNRGNGRKWSILNNCLTAFRI